MKQKSLAVEEGTVEEEIDRCSAMIDSVVERKKPMSGKEEQLLVRVTDYCEGVTDCWKE